MKIKEENRNPSSHNSVLTKRGVLGCVGQLIGCQATSGIDAATSLGSWHDSYKKQKAQMILTVGFLNG